MPKPRLIFRTTTSQPTDIEVGELVINNKKNEEGFFLKNNSNEIVKIENTEIPDADKNAPVVLFSGTLYSDNDVIYKTWQNFTVSGECCYHTGVSGLTIQYVNPGDIATLEDYCKP